MAITRDELNTLKAASSSVEYLLGCGAAASTIATVVLTAGVTGTMVGVGDTGAVGEVGVSDELLAPPPQAVSARAIAQAKDSV